METDDESRGFHDFRVVANDMGNAGKSVWMDGAQLKGVRDVKVKTSVDDVNLVRITFIANSINREDEGAK
jgi:hypothetical protein